MSESPGHGRSPSAPEGRGAPALHTRAGHDGADARPGADARDGADARREADARHGADERARADRGTRVEQPRPQGTRMEQARPRGGHRGAGGPTFWALRLLVAISMVAGLVAEGVTPAAAAAPALWLDWPT